MPNELALLIRARYPLIWLQTAEEERAVDLVCDVARRTGEAVTGWSQVAGLHEVPGVPRAGAHTDPLGALKSIRDASRQIWILKDLGVLCRGPEGSAVTRSLRETAREAKEKGSVLVVVGPGLDVPESLAGDASVYTLRLPDRADHRKQLQKIALGLKRPLADDAAEVLSGACVGLTLEQAENVWARVHASGGRFEVGDVNTVLAEKARIVRGSGVLEFVAPEDLSAIGGLENLKSWVQQRALGFTPRARDLGLPFPRGVLLVGVQGCGKSLAAKSVAGCWHQPLLRMDVGALMGSFVGQSEGNLRSALAIAERVAPCILWIDEIEKGFGGARESLDGGAALRMLGTLLTWLQERSDPVFVVATSNDITTLPPELLRKGRFDETFFVDLPSAAERRAIWEVHLGARARAAKDPLLLERVDLDALVAISEGFSGAEIAAAVVEGAFSALAADGDVDGAFLATAITASPPLSRQRAEDVDRLRAWAQGRARRAG
jgi:SpoVK/Ycf46/Vps4 family AAA+-type ATPase